MSTAAATASAGAGAGAAPSEADASKRLRSDEDVKDPSDLNAAIDATTVTDAVPDGVKCIGTHHGTFHCDEALACAMLKLLPEFKDMPIVRSRSTDVLAACHIVVDVGGEYDAARLRFDHHQRSFDSVYDSKHNIKMSSAGLVYKHYGAAVVQAALGATITDAGTLTWLVQRTYEHFIMEVDAVDNGVTPSDGPVKYKISTGLSSRVGQLNPAWNEPSTPGCENTLFKDAMRLTGGEFLNVVRRLYNISLPARCIVTTALDGAGAVHPSGRIMKLDSVCPWKGHLFDLEAERGIEGQILYALYPDTRGGWRIQCVPEAPDSFINRKSLPAAWRGIRDAELSKVADCPGAVFVHASGFIGGHTTYEGALQMATTAVDSKE